MYNVVILLTLKVFYFYVISLLLITYDFLYFLRDPVSGTKGHKDKK